MEQTPAASSPAEVDVFQGQEPTFAEFNSYRQTGEVPERFKPAETNDAPEETAAAEGESPEDAPDSDPEEAQEQPQKVSPAEKRIKQLLAEKKELQRKLEAAAKPTQSDSSTAQAQQQAPQNYDEWRKSFKPSEFVTKYGEQNPEATYEDAQAAMFEHLSKAEKYFSAIEQRQSAQKQALDAQINQARERYEDFDGVQTAIVGKLVSNTGQALIPQPVYDFIDSSDHLADLLYVIGSDEAELDKFVLLAKTNPAKAVRYVAKIENGIADELAKPTTAARGEDGKFKAPEKRQTSAPKPPSPVGGGSSRAFDVSDDSLSPEEWARKRNEQLSRKS